LPKHVAANIDRFTGRTWLLPKLLQWWEGGGERLFLLTGDPGSGKSMIVAWLAGLGPPPEDVSARAELARLREAVKAVHFCQAASRNIAPRAFAESIANQLTGAVAGFGDALAATLAERVSIVGTARAGTAAPGSNLTGVGIGRIDLGSLGDEFSFDRAFTEPLKKLYATGHTEPMLLVVDALDEAQTYTGVTVPYLLSRLVDLPPSVRILATTRDEPEVLVFFRSIKPVDLILDAGPNIDDVQTYAAQRLTKLATVDDGKRNDFAKRLSKQSGGVFLYAAMVLDELLARPLRAFPDLDTYPLPDGLSGIYHDFLVRELGVGRGLQRWTELYEPLLGLIAVAQGEGLTTQQLTAIIGKDIRVALLATKQYLAGELPDGPFRPFHKSFADFLLEEKNVDFHIDAAERHKAIAGYYQFLRDGVPVWKKWDDYGLLYVATHLAESSLAKRGGDPDQVEKLVRLVLDLGYQSEHKERTDNLVALQLDLHRALRAVASCDDERAVPLIVEAALGLVAFRRNELRPEPLFDLARQGQAAAAARRADLFDLIPSWRHAVRLIFAWLAAGVNMKEATGLRDTATHGDLGKTLACLIARLDAALGRQPLPPLEPLPAPGDELFTQALVERIAGGGANVELLSSELYASRGLLPPSASEGRTAKFLAEQDGPLLVSFAVANPAQGDLFLRQYLSIHTAYQYVYYRQASLWVLLGSVLRHPSQDWVREMLPELAISALAGSSAEFQEALPTTVLALSVLAGKSGAQQAFSAHAESAVQNARELSGSGDSWGFHKRRLAAIAQAAAFVPGMEAVVSDTLAAAEALPFGFAGFHSPACINLAEAIRICRKGEGAAQKALERAAEAAHSIQDESFCAQQTARVNAMRGWWKSGGFEVGKLAADLLKNPSAAHFTALHVIGECYEGRPAENTRIPNPTTLRGLADLYHQTVEEFVRVNPRWAPSEILQEGEEVKVPDPGFATQLAARFSAEALVQPGLAGEERIAWIRRLVPLAAANPTVLDTVLARLLLAAKPDGAALDMIERVGGSFPALLPITQTVRLPA